MKRLAIWVCALSLILGLSGPGVAQAHVKSFDTSLTLKVSDKRPDKGDRVTFTGKLSSPKSKCIKNKTIVIYRNQDRFGSTTTNGKGKYRLEKKVKRSGKYQARFAGFGPFGVHPHSHTCASSRSGRIKIRVQ